MPSDPGERLTQLAPERQSRTRSPANTSPFFSPRNQLFVLGFLLAIATVAVYYPVAKLPFTTYDDQIYVYENANVISGLHWETVRWAFTSNDGANWHPVTWLSHALDCQLFLLNPARHHEVNLLFHTVNVLLLFWVLQLATGYIGRSAMVASLFALHPVGVESVAWIAERKNLLSMTFFLLALGAYRWYASAPRVNRYLVVALLYALGLMSKAQVITLPCVLLLWDYWPLRRMFAGVERASFARGPTPAIPARNFSWLILEKVPLFVLSAAAAIITVKAQFTGEDNAWFPVSSRLENAIVSYSRYIRKAFWPSDLAVFYPHTELSLGASQVLMPFVVIGLITLLVAVFWQRRYLTVGWLWFVGTLVPMIGLVQVGAQGMADRYAYLPFIGLYIMVCWGVPDLDFSRCKVHVPRDEPDGRRHIPLVWMGGGCLAVLVVLAVATHRQIAFWDDDVALWSHALRVTDRNWTAEDNLGKLLANQGRTEESVSHFFKAVQIRANDPVGNLGVGAYEAQHGNPTEAIRRFQKVVAPSDVPPRLKALAFNDMGQAYADLGDYEHAGQSFSAAVRMNPGYFGAWIGLGVMAQKVGKLNLAVKAYSRAIEIQPIDWAYLLLAGALEQSGRREEARSAAERANSLSLDLNEAKRNADQKLAR